MVRSFFIQQVLNFVFPVISPFRLNLFQYRVKISFLVAFTGLFSVLPQIPGICLQLFPQ